MIVVGSLVVLALFLAVGWAVATEMFQQRSWRRRVEEGDLDIAAALIEEAMASWRRARAPEGVPAALWSGVQGAELVAVGPDRATVSGVAEAEFKSSAGARVEISSPLEAAMALAARLVDMLLYDVPNLRLGRVRVNIYTTFTDTGGRPRQQPILTTKAERAEADLLAWEAMTPAEVLGRFQTTFETTPDGTALPIKPPEDDLLRDGEER
ncbi:MAG: hypothetical protein ACE5EF_05755 [Dehalococcoidia bacterium]